MPENVFFIITYVVFGFSFLPASLIFLFFIRGSYVHSTLKIISFIDLITNLSNLTLYHLGLGDFEQQYLIYSIVQVICWIFLLNKNDFPKSVTWFLFSLSFIIFSTTFYFDNNILSPIYSKIIQLILGVQLLKIEIGNNLNKNRSSGFLLSVALITYSVITINILIFDNFISKMNVSNFNYTWSTHQFAALLYYILISISIWKSQKI